MLDTKKNGLDKSRLGRLLVNRGYITDTQLEEALHLQRATGTRLGEILIERGLITERALTRTLKQQQRYRYAAAFAAMVVAPLQPALSFAAPAPTLPLGGTTTEQMFSAETGLHPLSNAELRGIEARGLDELFNRIGAVTAMADGEQQADPMEGLKLAVRGLVPVINMFDADVDIRGVHYREGELPVRVLGEGKIEMMLPQQIERITLANIRPQDSNGASMGSIHISNIRFSAGSSIVVHSR